MSPEPAQQKNITTKAARLRWLLKSPQLSFLMEAHNGLSAKIVEEVGFDGIWASGLSMSAALGVRDSNEASWTQVIEQLEFMSDATSIPILVDGDTGYGNFNSVRRLVQKLCQRDIAGVCIEDKVFPKTNSFIGDHQELADVDEFCGRIKAGKDSQTDSDFQLVARVEALISGLGMEEALRRAHAYSEAGADAILMHSKKSTAREIVQFMKEWTEQTPVVIVPTMYYSTPADVFRDAGVSTVIWANHNLRASIRAMRDISRHIRKESSIAEVESTIPPVGAVFDLMEQDELTQAEARYLAPKVSDPGALVLAASRGEALGPLTEHVPKCMIDVRGRPLLRRLVSTLKNSGIRDVTVVRGYKKETIDFGDVETVDNDEYDESGEAYSLWCARWKLDGALLVSYGDILFQPHILDTLLQTRADIVTVVDARLDAIGHRDPSRVVDAVSCSRPYTGSYLEDEPVLLTGIGRAVAPKGADGEFIGLTKLSEKGAAVVRDELEAMQEDDALRGADLPAVFARILDRGVPITVVYIAGHWLDVDDPLDLANLRNEI